ncbi:MAG: 3-deoxy-7-phosphoheptulonate synthase [Rhodothermales bacterium]
MVVVMQAGVEEELIEAVIGRLSRFGFDVHRSSGVHQTVLGAIGVRPDFDLRQVQVLEGVAEVYRVTDPYKIASRTWRRSDTVIEVNGIPIGSDRVAVMAGPRVFESEEQLEQVATLLVSEGVRFLRTSLLRPKKAAHTPQWPADDRVDLIRAIASRHGLSLVLEVADQALVEKAADAADIFLVAAQGMQNDVLLSEVARTGKPVILQRGLAARIEDWLMGAEKILTQNNARVMLCEGGIRTFEPYTRHTLDLSSIPVVQSKSHLPVLADPSHGIGLRNKVTPMARAAVAAGAHGVLIDIHPDPQSALRDGPQALFFEQFVELMQQIRLIAEAVGRTVASPAGR